MRKIIVAWMMILSVMLTGCNIFSGSETEKENVTSIKIGVSVYDQYDTFISSLLDKFAESVKELELETGISITSTIANASGSQATQNNQIAEFIESGCDVICVNLVDRTDPTVIIDRAKNADIPVIFFNRELVKEDLERWDKLYYVGASATESGVLQGQIVTETCEERFDEIDKNGDGKLQYVMLEGEAGHQDALIRTEYVISTITEAGYAVDKLGDEIANWNRNQAENKMSQWIEKFGKEIEVVLANNDDMALGAIDALENSVIADKPIVVGVDGITEALNAVTSKTMLGTVINDKNGQAQCMAQLAYCLGTGTEIPEELELIEGKYIRLPYQIVTYGNIVDIINKYD